jgi:hypothetical protein
VFPTTPEGGGAGGQADAGGANSSAAAAAVRSKAPGVHPAGRIIGL